jgi:Notch 1
VVAIRGSTCVVAWEKLDTTTLNRDIMSRTSSDGCATFKAETKINVGSPTTRFAGRPQVGITSTDGIVWAWREQRANSTRDIFAAAAPDTTTAPTADLAIDTDAASDSDFPVLRVNETSAYLVWQDVATSANNGSDVMFARSTNGGTSWSAASVIDDPLAEVSSSFTPSLDVDPRAAGTADDVVAIAWEDRRQGTQVYASISSDGGASFATPIRASSGSNAPVTGQTSVPQIAAAGAGVLAVVYQNQQSTGRPHVFVATSIDSGVTWTVTAHQVDGGTGSALAPQVIASQVSGKPAAVAAWADFRTNQIDGDIYAAVSH